MIDPDVLKTWHARLDKIRRAVVQAEQANRIRPTSARLILDQLQLAQERVATLELHSDRWLTDPLRSARILCDGTPDIEQAIIAAICRVERTPEPIIARPKPKKARVIKPYDGPVDTQCAYGGCNRKVRARGYCALHYAYMRKNGKIEVNRRGKEWCMIDGCENHVYGKNLCAKHYENLKRTGNPLGMPRETQPPRKCAIDGCERLATYRGMCSKHEYRNRRYGGTSLPPKSGTYTICKPGQKQCIIEGCSHPQVAFELCMLHYRRRRRMDAKIQRTIRRLSRPLKIRNRSQRQDQP